MARHRSSKSQYCQMQCVNNLSSNGAKCGTIAINIVNSNSSSNSVLGNLAGFNSASQRNLPQHCPSLNSERTMEYDISKLENCFTQRNVKQRSKSGLQTAKSGFDTNFLVAPPSESAKVQDTLLINTQYNPSNYSTQQSQSSLQLQCMQNQKSGKSQSLATPANRQDSFHLYVSQILKEVDIHQELEAGFHIYKMFKINSGISINQNIYNPLAAAQGPESFGYCRRMVRFSKSGNCFEIIREYDNSDKRKVESKIQISDITNLIVHPITQNIVKHQVKIINKYGLDRSQDLWGQLQQSGYAIAEGLSARSRLAHERTLKCRFYPFSFEISKGQIELLALSLKELMIFAEYYNSCPRGKK